MWDVLRGTGVVLGQGGFASSGFRHLKCFDYELNFLAVVNAETGSSVERLRVPSLEDYLFQNSQKKKF